MQKGSVRSKAGKPQLLKNQLLFQYFKQVTFPDPEGKKAKEKQRFQCQVVPKCIDSNTGKIWQRVGVPETFENHLRKCHPEAFFEWLVKWVETTSTATLADNQPHMQSVSSDSESPENFRLDNIADALPQTIKAEDAMQESSLSIDDAQMFIDDQDIVDFNYHAAMKGVTFKDDPEIAQIWLHGQCNEFLSPSLPLQPPRRKSSNDSMDHVEYDAAAYFGSSGAEAAGTTNAAKLPNTGENVVSKGISRVSDNPAGSTGHDTQFYDPRNILTRKSSSKVHLAQLSEQVQWEDQIDFRLRQLQCFVSSLTRSQGDTKLHEEGLIQPRVDAPYTTADCQRDTAFYRLASLFYVKKLEHLILMDGSPPPDATSFLEEFGARSKKSFTYHSSVNSFGDNMNKILMRERLGSGRMALHARDRECDIESSSSKAILQLLRTGKE